MSALPGLFGKIPFTHRKKAEELPARISRVAVFGGSHVPEESIEFKTVVLVSKKLAEAGFMIIDGGGPGVMKAATIGAKEGGGRVIGVTLYPDDMPGFEGRDKGNLVDEEIKTHSYVERTLTLMREGQVFVIFKGGTGTISEFGMAWGLAKLYFGHHKPLILYGQEWRDIIETFKKNMLLRQEELEVYKIVDSPEEVVPAIRDFETELARGEHPNIKASINHR